MAINAKKLKKNHFWILAAAAPVLALLAVGLYANDVGTEVETAAGKIQKDTDAVKAARAKGKLVLTKLDGQKDKLFVKREELWKDNWDRQTAGGGRLFDWPTEPNGQRLKQLADTSPKFGAPLTNKDDAFQVFTRREVYEAAYDRAADVIKPTVFANRNWRGVLRYVSDWGAKVPRWEQLWLALEDLWVQRGLLGPVVEVNDIAARFAPVKADPDSPLKRTFRSPVWEIALEVATDPASGKRVLKSKITNRTPYIQFFGMRNTMRLKVWLSDRPTTQPVLYRIEGEFVKAGESKDVPVVARLHEIPAEVEVEKIARVEQVLDERTVPVRQVLNIEVGYKDARNNPTELKSAEFYKDDPLPTDPATGQLGGPTPSLPGGSTMPSSYPGSSSYPGGAGGPGGLAGAAAAKAGPPALVLDLHKKRYLEVSPQVRRMPVAVVLLVDQSFMQDALTAYANSPLRLQITQVHWQRFRGLLPPPLDPADPSELPATRGGPGPVGFAVNPEDGPGPSGGSPGYGYPGSGGYPGAAGGLSTVSEGQLTTGLVELTIYGTVSLYERYDPKADPTAPPVPAN